MKTLSKNKTGLSLAAFDVLFHAVWAVLVAIGAAKPVLDGILSLHFISLSYTMKPFEMSVAIGLLALTGGVGYVSGWVFAGLWNHYHSE